MLRATPMKLPDVLLLDYEMFEDNRGTSFKTFSDEEMRLCGITTTFIEERVYCPRKKGTLYGIHFQNRPCEQAKLLYCIQGKGLDFAVDLRKDSPTYKSWCSALLTPENRRQIYIPHGFGHAFVTLEDDTQVVMRFDRAFSAEHGRSITYLDSEIGLEIPFDKTILSQQDSCAPSLGESDCNL